MLGFRICFAFSDWKKDKLKEVSANARVHDMKVRYDVQCTQTFFAKIACMCSVVKCFLNIYECECGCVCVIWLESALALALKR